MSTLKKRSRVGIAVATATLSTASMFALATPANAAAVEPNPVQNMTAVLVAPGAQVKVDWDAAFTGETATSYVVTFEATDNLGVIADTEIVLPVAPAVLPATELVWKDGVAGKTYNVRVFANNAFGSSNPATVNGVGPIVAPVDCTLPGAPVPPCPVVIPDTRPFRPFNNWDALIKQEYQDWVGRAPRLDELTFWKYVLTTSETGNAGYNTTVGRIQLVSTLAEEAEQTDGPAYRLYTAYFSRNADFGGLTYWSKKLRSGWSLLQVSEFFVKSSEFRNTYGEYETNAPEGPKTDAAEFVALVYANVLDRTPDGSGFAFWTRQLQSGRYSPAEVMVGFSEATEFKNKLQVRVGSGMAFAHMLRRMPTEAEYVLAEFYNEYFPTSPIIDGQGFNFSYDLYVTIFDSAPYKARVTKG